MCGLVASLDNTSTPSAHLGLRLLRHRGPDHADTASLDLGWCAVTVGVTRLAVVEARPHGLPFRDPATGVIVALNGEIYNWKDLRSDLSNGHPWTTQTDTEVVARAWDRWGLDMLPRLNGMFALVVVDPRTRAVLLARDRAGEKPLYWTRSAGALHVASEIKALPVPLREGPCPDADVLEFDCQEETPFVGVRALPPGHYACLTGDLDPLVIPWWHLPEDTREDLTLDGAVDEAECLVVDAIRLRAQSDLGVALALSGGLDSAIVQTVARTDRLYTCTFPEVDFLGEAARATAGQGAPRPVTFDRADVEDLLPLLAWHLDTPATWTAACQWFVARAAARDGATIVLAGEGADEIFGGYARYALCAHLDAARRDPRLAGYDVLRARLVGTDDEILARLLDRSDGRCLDHALALVRRYAGTGDLVTRACRLEWHTTMQVLLRMADRTTSAFGLESRAPFLDHRVVEFAARLPARLKADASGLTKPVLRCVARRLGVPETIVNEPTKKGYFLPWAAWTGAAAWERAGFAARMREAWRTVFFGRSASWSLTPVASNVTTCASSLPAAAASSGPTSCGASSPKGMPSPSSTT